MSTTVPISVSLTIDGVAVSAEGTAEIPDLTTGPAGPQGPAGTVGPAGVAGPIGPAGAQGPAGATGAAGPSGAAGAKGATGATGPAGVAGASPTAASVEALLAVDPNFIKAVAAAVSGTVSPPPPVNPPPPPPPPPPVTTTGDFFITPNGSDSNPGTQAAPWAITSLQDKSPNNAKIAAKVVVLAPGTYPLGSLQSTSQPGDYEHPILHLPAGTATNPTTVISATPRAAILDWTGNTSANSVIGQNPSLGGNWAINGLMIKGGTSAGSSKQVGYYPAAGAGPVTIQNCDMGAQTVLAAANGSNDGAIFQQGANNTVIKGCKFHDIHKPTQIDHVHALIEYSCTGTQFLNNDVLNCDTGIDGKVGCSGATAAYNYFYNTGTGGSFCAPIQGYDGAQGNPNSPTLPSITAHHNVFDSCGPVRACDVNNVTSQKFSWYNNTVYDTRSGSLAVWDLRASVAGATTFHDNVTVTTALSGGGSYGRLALTSGDVALCDFNCYGYSNSGGGFGLSATLQGSLVAWQTASKLDAHSIAVDPKFVGPIVPGSGPGQFNLQSTSPCLKAGTGGATMGAWDGTVTQIGSAF